MPGALVTLGKTGLINVGYLGSDPHLFKAPPLDLKQLNFSQAHTELLELEAVIQKATDVSDTTVLNAAAERFIKVQINVGSLEKCTFISKATVIDDFPKMVRVSVGIKTIVALEQVQICLNTLPPLKASIDRFMFSDLKPEQIERFDSFVFVERSADVPNPYAKLMVSFTTPDATIRVIERKIQLPMTLICKPTHHQKDAKYRITLMVPEGEQQDLSKMFPDYFLDSTSQAIGLRSLFTAITTTVAISRSSSRLRVQSEHIEAVSCELEYVLEKLSSKKALVAPPNLPIDALIDFTKEHQNLRDNFNYILVEMDRRNAELRLFELRYNIKSQEPNAKVLGIQYLIDLTNSKLNALEKRLKEVEEEISTHQIRLSCILSVIRVMINHVGISKQLSDMVASAMCPTITNFLEQSWEELMSPALDYILQSTSLKQQQREGGLDDIGYLTVTRFDFSFEKFLKQLREVLVSIMQIAIKAGGNINVDDDFARSDSTDMIEEEKNDWVADELPAGAAVLIRPNLDTDNEVTVPGAKRLDELDLEEPVEPIKVESNIEKAEDDDFFDRD